MSDRIPPASLTRSALPTLLICLVCAPAARSAQDVVDIGDCGAVPDGKTLNTVAIQKAVDQCAVKGGGIVRFPAGKWLTGTVYLESNITLVLEKDCTILGSRKHEHYRIPRATARGGDDKASFRYAAIFAGSKLEHVTITGEGTIDGQGSAFRDKKKLRPKAIYLVDCRDVLIEKIHLRNAGSWMQHYRKCERLTIRGINVFNHIAYNNDGLNVDSCRDVTIANCRIDSDDDGIVLKSLSLRPCERITVRNCVVSSHCNGIKLGTESGGGFKAITVSDCVVHSPRKSKKIYGRQRGLAGVALEIVDGGTLDDVKVSNVAIDGVSVPIFLRLGNRARIYEKGSGKPDVGTFGNVELRNIAAKNCSPIGCSITGLPGHRITNVTLENITLGFDGGGEKRLASREVRERPEAYPESTMFGDLPAYGFYCRHVEGITFRNVSLRTAKPDLRHAMVFDDAKDITLERFHAAHAPDAAAVIRMTQTREATLIGCVAAKGVDPFLLVQGQASGEIRLQNCALSSAKRAVELGPNVPKSAVQMMPAR